MALPRYDQDRASYIAGASANRRTSDPMDIESDPISPNHKARVGLLSHTLVPSPVIQWVLPARLRGKKHSDVVFVGERSLQIKETVSGVHLEGVTSKSDFDAHIMAAKVINVGTELPWEAQMKLGASSATKTDTQERHDDLPTQILILSLASRELVFLYYSKADAQFIHHHRPLPNDVSTFERLGRNIAIEPRSRAVAVSASCDYFGVFILKKPHVLQSQIADNQLDPIAEERFFRVDGDILFMEFLYPKAEDSGKIILLLLVSQDQLTHAICYEWDANEPLLQASPAVTKRLLPNDDRLPTMLIPLTKISSFMLVSTTSMTIYKNKLDPRSLPSRNPIPVPDRESQRSPLWTRWARPLRNWVYNQKHDDIYLCREDGRIFYLGVGNEGEVDAQSHLGQLCCDVDAAFDILDVGHHEGGDLLLAAGNTGDGGLFVQKARDHPRCLQKFMNWTPVTDSVLVASPNQNPSGIDVASDRFFVCSASSFARGAIVELRHGIEAQIGSIVPLEELSSTRDIWTMSDSVNGGVYVLISDPVSSVLLQLSADFGDDISAIDEVESGLDFGAQTLAAGCTDTGVIIQVTDKAIHLGSLAETLSSFRFHYDAGQSIAVAAVDRSASLIAVAVRTQFETHLHVKRTAANTNQLELSDIGQSLRLHHEPVCISIEAFDTGCFVFIGTGNGKVLVYRVEEDSVTFILEASVVVEGDEISKAIESIAAVSTVSEEPRTKNTLLCGLRSGILVPFDLALNHDSVTSPIGVTQATPQRLGNTSVKIEGSGNLALLTCGQGFWQLSCTQHGETLDHTLQKIWITDQNNPAYHPKSIFSFSINSETAGFIDALFCISDGQLLICSLGQDAKTVPRRIDLPGSATKLAYSQHLKSLIVAYSQTEFDTNSDPIKRYTRARIEFVDPDLQHAVLRSGSVETPVEDEPPPWRPQGAAGEKISCILEWTPRKGDEEYHFIVIGTARRNQAERGRVIFLQTARSASDPSRIECSVKYIHRFEGPVYSIAPYGAFTLMVSTGHEVVPLEPKFSPTRAARYSVLSPAISMTAREPYLYMSTSRESLIVLKASDDKLTLKAYDRQKHDGLAHVHIGGDMKLTLASSRGGRVSLLTEHGVTENDKMMPVALCEAHLPSSVMRLCPGTKHSPVSSHSQKFYGTAMNGTVYRFMTLREHEWRLLRLLQNLCVRDTIICPFTPKRKRQRNPVGNEPLEFQPSHMHIDGDILSRLLMRGSSYLTHMLATGDFYNPCTPETGSPQAIRERFTELAEEVVGESSNTVEAVMGWLKRSLHVEF